MGVITDFASKQHVDHDKTERVWRTALYLSAALHFFSEGSQMTVKYLDWGTFYVLLFGVA